MSTGPLDPQSRDAALQKLRDWRLTIALGSAGAVVCFATVAAVTIPGKDSSASTGGSSGSPVPDNTGSNDGSGSDDQSQQSAPSDQGGGTLQQPLQNPAFGLRGGGQAVSGGSR